LEPSDGALSELADGDLIHAGSIAVDPRSETNLVHVHPDLVAVIRATSQIPQAFEVICGLRSLADEKHDVATGHSKTLHSRHLANKDGFACAVDVVALIDGQVSFAEGNEAAVFGQIWGQVSVAAAKLKIQVEWGGGWNFHDWGHIQLPWRVYP
jgi:peptidoglycan L-alanyl-D-glutamate endopeptidase CwlK